MVNRLYVLIAVLSLSVLNQSARANLITYTASFGPQTFSLGTQIGGNIGNTFSSTLNWNASLGINFIFPQFDPTLGTLNDVRLTFAGATGLTADILYASNQLPFAGINVNMTTNFVLNDATSSVVSTDNNFVNNTITATSSSTPFNFNVGTDGANGPLVSVPVSNHVSYLGLGTVTLPMNVQFLAQATTSNGIFAVTPFPVLALSPVQLEYHFSPVPEPGSLSLCVLSFAVLATARRKRSVKKKCSLSSFDR